MLQDFRSTRSGSEPLKVGPRAAIINRSQRQQPPNLGGILCLLRQPPERRPVKVSTQRNRSHHAKPPFGMMSQKLADLGIWRVL
ncbi:hypothetical protein NGR_b13450 (plasmid) [Sinorhizobium fredii NGR234]|uniref:Uncharacterized protein n=1 Tax=Sinorhizobium fredii (strain NBRC 101917 / NGR234) TaxID=394 RepID=C3KRT8_SINFN|nr:hypothetical protein NGR_b13450 [Sinorhizobium fredii NGR234]